jgi:hypothetical protein
MNVVTGTATVTTVVQPKNFVGQLMLVSRDGFTLASGGNVSLITNPNVLKPGAHIMLTWIPSMAIWVSDTCRLTNTRSGMSLDGRNVLIEPPTATDFPGGSYVQIGKFVLASLVASSVEVELPTAVADGASWGGPVFNASGILYHRHYTYLSVQADGGGKTAKLMQSGTEVATRPVEPVALQPDAQWQGTIWYRAQ